MKNTVFNFLLVYYLYFLCCNLPLLPNELLPTLFSDTLQSHITIIHTFKIVAYFEIGIRILTDLTCLSVVQVFHCISAVPQVHAVCIISMVLQRIIPESVTLF